MNRLGLRIHQSLQSPQPAPIGRRPRAGALAVGVALLVALAGCGSDADQDTNGDASAEATEDPDTYTLANREQFLASGPDCDAMTTWFSYNPRDEDLPTIGRHIEECGTIPEAHANNGYVMLELREEIFEAAEADSPTRGDLHKALAAEACTAMGNGERSPYQVAYDVDVDGGTPDDTAAVLELAAETCTDHAGDLLVFTTDNLLQAGEDLTAFAGERWPGGIAGTPELVAMAQMVCTNTTDPFEVEMTDSLIETGLATGAATEFRTYVENNMCA